MEQNSFGKWLRLKRKALDLSRAGLADRVGYSAATIRKIEAEERRPSAQIVERLAQIFQIPQNERTALFRFARGDWKSAPREIGEDLPWRSSSRVPHSNLPSASTSLIGREQDIIHVRDYLFQSGIRLVTLIGPPGIGKTRLSIAAAREFPDDVFFVALAPLENPTLLARTIAQSLGYIAVKNRSASEQLREGIGDRHLLLVLDNCEHLIENVAALVSDLLSSCSQLKILATSRESLHIAGEWLYSVPALNTPQRNSSVSLANTSEFPALTLFTERARAVRPGFALDNDNIAAVSSICARLDGLPLAIELAAARVRFMTAVRIASRLDNTFRILTGGSKSGLPRQQTLKATLDWSYDLLSPKERLLLQRLSVFAGGWTLEAAEAVCADKIDEPARPEEQLNQLETIERLANLVDKSLVIAVPGEYETRYRMLETIRQYACERLMEAGCSRQVRDRHLNCFARLSGQAEPHLRGKGQVEWLERLDQELDNLRAALEWSLSGHVELGLKIAADLMWFWQLRALFNEGFEWLEMLLEAETAQRGAQPLAGDRALQRARGLRAFAYQGNYLNIKSLAERAAIYQESIAILRALAPLSRRELGISLFFLLFHQGILDQASPIREEMLEILHKENEKFYLSEYFFVMAAYAEDWDQAIDLENTSLALAREIEDLDGISSRSATLGGLLLVKGAYAEANALFQEAIVISREVKNYWSEAAFHNGLSKLAMVQGNYNEAIYLAEAAISKFRALNYLHPIHLPLENLQQIAWSQGKYGESIQYAQEIIASFKVWQHQNDRPYLYLGRAEITQGDLAQAEMYLRRAIPPTDWRETTLRWSLLTPHLLGWIALFRKQGKYLACARLIGAVDSIYHQIATGLIPRERSEFADDCAAARAALDEEAFAAALDEGQALTLEQAIAWVAGEMQADGE